MKTNSVLTVNQQPKDPWQTNTLPGQNRALSLQQEKLLFQLKQDLVGLKGIVPNSHTAEGQSGSTVSLMPQWLSCISGLLMRMKKEDIILNQQNESYYLQPPKPHPQKAMAPHSSTLAWTIPWMEEPGRLQSMGSLRVGHD